MNVLHVCLKIKRLYYLGFDSLLTCLIVSALSDISLTFPTLRQLIQAKVCCLRHCNMWDLLFFNENMNLETFEVLQLMSKSTVLMSAALFPKMSISSPLAFSHFQSYHIV